MSEICYREMLPDELTRMLKLRNSIFVPITEKAWKNYPGSTASVALMDGEFVGAIPLSQRPLQIRPGQIIRSVYENAVGVREDLRSKGVGHKIIDSAKNFMKDRSDALMVIPAGENSKAHHFYQKSGHVDLHFIQGYFLNSPEKYESVVKVAGLDEFLAAEKEVAPVFQSCYADYGGFPARQPGYWKWALSSSIYESLPCDFASLWLRKEGRLIGYALLGTRTKVWADKKYHIMEMGMLHGDDSIAEELIRAAGDFAAKKKMGVHMDTCRWHPGFQALQRLGFEAEPRQRMFLGQWIDPQVVLQDQIQKADSLKDVTISVRTINGNYEAVKDSGKNRIILEMKHDTLTRWLFGRIDLIQAIRMELVTATGEDSTIQAVSEALPFTPWIYHEVDYI